ncbi:c-type cytochrome [Brevundimonas lutea]|uniref:c-type cytochrome n=1 Tax=Brevundimonas lutea TaxID=2293980 RepID=UPI0013CE5422|nr:cytochrome c [Brevundimonas lutea]
MKHVVVIVCAIAVGSCGSLEPTQPTRPGLSDIVSSMPSPQRGTAYAQANCASCHATGSSGESPLLVAPPFRSLSLRYPVSDLAEAFAEGIITAHPAMPEFEMTPSENADLIAYLESVQSPTDPGT